MKVYKEVKKIEIKDIKWVNTSAVCGRNLEKIRRYVKLIDKKGINKPFEVIQKGNEYYILSGWIKLIAAEVLGYDKVPCLIRDKEKEILLRKICKIVELEDENYIIKSNKRRQNPYRKNYYKLNILQ